ncbi:UPF0175 family protein [Halorussus salilacus]|uniref:UPF0175 family protein n=1 Tax=Halorussus salilacus TaxID=2953750 RepID=UPI00209D10C0|nr:UPF0175 family protein [Halorussus salilacus]USZ67427.1 UPF0175 family protein [Halorussus salilacus]
MDRESRALAELGEGEASFSKAAEIAGMNPWEFAELVAREDVTWVGDDHLEADLRDL